MPDPTAPPPAASQAQPTPSPVPPQPTSAPTPTGSAQPPAPAQPAAQSASPAAGQRVLDRLLDRLFASLVNGPGLNCRPHRSRQRIDWFSLAALNDLAPAEALRELLGEDRATKLRARVVAAAKKAPVRRGKGTVTKAADEGEDVGILTDQPSEDGAPAQTGDEVADGAKPQAASDADAAKLGPSSSPSARFGAGKDDADRDPWDEQNALVQKLGVIADDARTYEQDTGVHALYVGFPLLSLPPTFAGGTGGGGRQSRRVLAPVAFVPVSLALRRGTARGVEIACRGEGIDLVQPNTALLAWLERQTGRDPSELGDPFADEKGEDPWREVADLVRRVCHMVDLPVPEAFAGAEPPERRGEGADTESPEDASHAPTPGPAAPSPVGRAQDHAGTTGRGAPRPVRVTADEDTGLGVPRPVATDSDADGSANATPATDDPPATDDAAPDDDAGSEPAEPPAERAVSDRAVAVALELQPAPRTEDLDDAPAILPAAVIGLFPTANQGLLRDMQAMADEPAAVRGPVEAFIRLEAAGEKAAAAPVGAGNEGAAVPAAAKQGVVGPVGAASPTGATAPTGNAVSAGTAGPTGRPAPRVFTEERLVAEADPCQAKAVRVARHSRALVIHGPPGTGKSQTIANIIGDHLARGQRVLFVCEKRTALDVVADRLEHMGLGGLCGVVHDPQRDQRDLYRKIREQLENLADNAGDPRAHARLAEVDEELQKLHAELTAYHAALAKRDPATGLSFHDLMGQWLAASPGKVLGAAGPAHEPRVKLDAAATAGLEKARLAELTALEHALHETFRRGVRTKIATNPWTNAVGIGTQALLARPVEDVRAAVRAVVAATVVADETSREKQPLLPPFVPAIDLPAQAQARVQLADWVRVTLDVMLPDVLDRWAGREVAAMRAARAKLTEAQPYLTLFKQQPPDPELAARWRTAYGAKLPDAADLTAQRQAVQRYADAFDTSMVWVNEVCQKAPRAKWPAVARWLAEDTQSAAGVWRKLEAAAPLAERAAQSPLDPELAAQFRRQPADIPQVLRWLSALETYLPVAGALLGFLHGAKKKAAAPAVEFFGLGLTGENAKRVRDFLAGVRARLEVREALLNAAGPESLGGGVPPPLPEDDVLLDAFEANRSVLKAAADLQRHDDPEMARAADATALVNRMVAAEHAAAAPLFELFALPATPQNARRITATLQALAVRLILQELHDTVLAAPTPDDLMEDRDLEVSIRAHAALFDLAIQTTNEPALAAIWPAVAAALADPAAKVPLLADALRLSPKRAADVLAAERAMADAGLFNPGWLERADAALRAGQPLAPGARLLEEQLDTLEDVVRVHEAVGKLPPTVRPATIQLLQQSADVADAWDALRRDVLAGEVRRRLAADPHLQAVDGQRLESVFDRFRKLNEKKRDHVREDVVHMWLDVQRRRLLNDAGTKLSAAGKALERRLLLRGERAMRLRKVVAMGRGMTGGDPLFDVCPVWMVSPETAAQVFPREPIFDVVVFDEASQLRLEEALPVLTRGKRVVVAGDPKQLPPTRFFETAFAASDEDDEPADDQGWFEQHQGEVEDLLTAALGLDADQSYLDVHYRSRNADLIEFSNANFYGRRLQPIPGHPSRRPKLPPIRVVRADGVYEKRRNEAEADAVVALVAELLAERKPPSIGIACFNLVQRDLIVEKLDERAAADAKFAKRLAEARERSGAGTFEGLFVKNLENVQGDERDHMIISTTYGPDAAGRFYRRFGPLAMPGGGRRMNVLVTRARQQVHLVTSIPAEQYRSLPEPPEGQTPGGGWLLFSYLKFADELAREYEGEAADNADSAAGGPPDAAAGDSSRVGEPPAPPPSPVTVRPTRAPSVFAEALARKLAAGH
ncbi:MAG TPA: AAA domain-containing protein, partial [Humisphaera sp.]